MKISPQSEPLSTELRVIEHLIEQLHQMHPRTLHETQEPGLFRIELGGDQQLTRTQDAAQ